MVFLPHKDERDDPAVRDKLGPYYRRALRGELDDWKHDTRGRLALIVLFDQVPRHLFRDRPRQYATDERARTLAAVFFDRGFPKSFSMLETFYAALPYLHAEDPVKQKQVNPIMHAVARSVGELDFMGDVADRYKTVIDRFGRFPHRNAILGRDTTPAEADYLEEPSGSG